MGSIYQGRRQFKLKALKSPSGILSFLISTAFGAGLCPLAPGTAGTLIAVPLVYFLHSYSFALEIGFWILLFGISIWACKKFDELHGPTGDNQNIVIDEVLGYGITALTAGQSWQTLCIAFLLFRLFDVVKLPPVRQVDLWSKGKGSWWGAFGVIADDALAGAQGLIVILILQYMGILS